MTSSPARAGLATRLLKAAQETVYRYADVEGYRLAASISYYALFSIFPLLLLAVAAFGFFLGHDDHSREQVLDVVHVDQEALRSLLDQSLRSMQSHVGARSVATVVAALSLLYGASGVMGEVIYALDRIFRTPAPKYDTIWHAVAATVARQLNAIVSVFAVALLLFVTFIGDLALEIAEKAVFSPNTPQVLIEGGELAVSFVILTLAFWAMLRYVPKERVAWRPALIGGAMAAILVSLVRSIFTIMLVRFSTYAAYGAAGSMLALGMWIYLSAQGFLIGAQLAEVLATNERNDA